MRCFNFGAALILMVASSHLRGPSSCCKAPQHPWLQLRPPTQDRALRARAINLKPAPRFPIGQRLRVASPLAFAVRQIVPASVRVRYADGVDQDALVDWTGGKPWNEILVRAVKPLGLHVQATPAALLISPIAHSRQGSRSCSRLKEQANARPHHFCRYRLAARARASHRGRFSDYADRGSALGSAAAYRSLAMRSTTLWSGTRSRYPGTSRKIRCATQCAPCWPRWARPVGCACSHGSRKPACPIRTPCSARCWRWTRAGPDGRYGTAFAPITAAPFWRGCSHPSGSSK